MFSNFCPRTFPNVLLLFPASARAFSTFAFQLQRSPRHYLETHYPPTRPTPPTLLTGGSVGVLPGVPSRQTQTLQSRGSFPSLRWGISAWRCDSIVSWHEMCHQGGSRVTAGGMRCIAMEAGEALVRQGEAHRLAIPAAGCSICVSANCRPRPLLAISRACKFCIRARRVECVCPLIVSGVISLSGVLGDASIQQARTRHFSPFGASGSSYIRQAWASPFLST